MPPTQRLGVTLVELMVAMLLLLLVLSIGALATRRTLGMHHDLALADDRASAVSDALTTLARHAGSVRANAGDIRVARDTAVEFTRDVGVTIVCRAMRDTIIIGTGGDSLPWSTHLPRTVTTDDEIRLWSDADALWTSFGITAVGSASGACADSLSAPLGNATQRLVLSDTTAPLRTGATAIVRQRERWSLVRGGDGAWSLSMATWDAAGSRFVVPQPLLTPLAPPGSSDGPGLRVRAIDAAGNIVADSATRSTTALLVTLRTARNARLGTLADSVRINVGRD